MDNNSNPLVSIITPVYNAEKYLADCIESVVAQTYDNWDYVIINNCSTDRSLEIAEKYAKKDSRIRIFNNKSFLDVMPNLNHSMLQISHASKYCKVVHADDWVFPECLKRMVEVAERYPSAGIIGAYRLDETRVNLDGLPYGCSIFSGRGICRQTLLGYLYVFGSPSSILIRSELIKKRQPFYNEHSFHADKEVCFELLKKADFGFVYQVLTFTRRHNESETTLSRRYNTYRIGKLSIMKKYGPVFLSPEEYRHRFRTLLAKSLYDFNGLDFFRFHKSEMNKLGIELRPIKLFFAALKELMNFLHTAKIIKNRLAH